MWELFARLLSRPLLATEMVAASLLANVLALAMPLFVIQVLNRYVAHGVDATLGTLAAGVLIAIVLELCFRQIRTRLAANVNASYDRTLAVGAFGTLAHTKAAALEQVPEGMRNEMVSGAEKVQSAFNANNVASILDVPFALLFIGVLFLLNTAIATVVACFVGAAFLICVIGLFSLRRPSRDMQRAASRRGGLVGSASLAMDTIRAFNAGPFITKQWQSETGAFQRLYRRVTGRQGFVQSLGMTLQAMMGVAVISIGAIQVVAGTMDVGAMIGANILAARALGPVIKFAMMSESLAKANQARAVFREFARLPRERTDGTALTSYRGGLEFKDLAFAHPGAKTPLFESLNLKVEPGSVLIFAGANGTGKTTLARLLVGLVEPTRGHVLADGVDLQQLAPEWWRSQVMYMPQEPHLLNATVAENIALARPTMSIAQINELVETAGLRDWIDQSPSGVETQITNNGANLSLGIRRRIALARALATEGRVMIIDDPTEGLDADGCQQVIAAMNETAKSGRTVLAFTHDPQILRSAPHYVDLNVKPVPALVRRPVEVSPAADPDAAVVAASDPPETPPDEPKEAS